MGIKSDLPFLFSDDQEISEEKDVDSLFVDFPTKREPGINVTPHESLHFTFFDQPAGSRHDGYALDVGKVQLIGHDQHFVNALSLACSLVALLDNLARRK